MDSYELSLDAIRGWCDRAGFRYLYNEKLGQLALPRDQGQPPIRVVPQPERKMLTLAVVLPFAVPEDRFDAVARAATLANSSSFMGSWVLNSQKGDLYFRVTLPTLGVRYDDQSLRFVINVVVGTSNILAKAFYDVAIEGGSHELILEAQKGIRPPG